MMTTALDRGSRRAKAFGDGVRGTLEVLASHMAVSLANARMVKRLEELATLDGLTGLLNKRAMLEMADQKILAAKRFHRKLSVLVTDIDHFKKINDTYGHVAGDSVLRQLALVVKPRLRGQDCLARVGGEEFAVLLPEVDNPGARVAADKVRAIVEAARFLVDNKEFGCTVSVGLITFDARMTYERADSERGNAPPI